MSRFLFGRYVEGDLHEIRSYIRKESPESARRMMIHFVDAFRLLASRPGQGHIREDLADPLLRFRPVGSYLVVYLAEKRQSRSLLLSTARGMCRV